MQEFEQIVQLVGFPATMCVLFFLNSWKESEARRAEQKELMDQLRACESRLAEIKNDREEKYNEA